MRNKKGSCFNNVISFFFSIVISTTGYSQREIVKNGIKINKLDKKNKKQGSWFFFDKEGNLDVSCYYENDSIVKPILFYKKQDSAFIRYPKINNEELFLLKSNGKWLVGSCETLKKDSLKIEILGLYKKVGKDSIDIVENTVISNSIDIKNEASYWIKKEIQPIYMFGTESIRELYYRVFSTSKFTFNKKICIDVTINESGQFEKINFPRNKNNLSSDEENDLMFHFSAMMKRWQPLFSRNKTERVTISLEIGGSFK
jgi:hypothetical protein